MQISSANDLFVIRSKSSNNNQIEVLKQGKDVNIRRQFHCCEAQRYFWNCSLTAQFSKATILAWRAQTVKNGKNHAFANACWGNGHHISPTREIRYGCFLLVFGSSSVYVPKICIVISVIIFNVCLGAGSRQFCRYTKSPLGITPLRKFGSQGKFDLGGVWTHDLCIRSSIALPTELRGKYGSSSGVI